MYRMILLPDLIKENSNKRAWRRAFYSIILTSVEFFLALIALISGLPVLIDPFSLSLVAGSLTELLPHWMVLLWGIQMSLGGTATMTGIISGDFRVEQIGVMLLLGGAFIYALALMLLLPSSFMAFVTYVLFVLAMGARYWVLSKLIKMTGKMNKKAIDLIPDKREE